MDLLNTVSIYLSEIYDKITPKKKLKFFALKSGAAKIKFLFSLCKDDLFPCVPPRLKDLQFAEELKVTGNHLFAQHNYIDAVNNYNAAIAVCPQDDLAGKKLYAILIGNRSAAFFNNGDYEKVLIDIVFLNEYGHHPSPNKIKARGQQARDALTKLATQQSTTIEFEINGSVKTPLCEELTWKSGNITYPALSENLKVKINGSIGRHVVATRNFKTGAIVAVESPMVLVALGEKICSHCGMSSNQIHACAKCALVAYCSIKCLKTAEMYHQFECNIAIEGLCRPLLQLALRMITKFPKEQILKERKKQNIKYEDIMDEHTLLLLYVTATFFLKLLIDRKYFNPKDKLEKHDLSDDNVFVGELLFEYLYNLQFITQRDIELLSVNDIEINYRTTALSIYQTVSLFTHSCNPSVIGYNIKNKLVLRCIRPIKAGEIVTYNKYTDAFYFKLPKQQRIMSMRENKRSSCSCQACVEDWPIPKKGLNQLLNENVDCRRINQFVQDKLKLTDVLDMTDQRDLQKLVSIFTELLDELFKYLQPQSCQISDAQAALVMFFSLLGNKCVDYKVTE